LRRDDDDDDANIISQIHTADADDATQLSSLVASAVCTECATSWVGDSFDESEQIYQQRVELRCDGGVNAPVGIRRELVAIIVFTPPTRLNRAVASSRRRRCVLGNSVVVVSA